MVGLVGRGGSFGGSGMKLGGSKGNDWWCEILVFHGGLGDVLSSFGVLVGERCTAGSGWGLHPDGKVGVGRSRFLWWFWYQVRWCCWLWSSAEKGVDLAVAVALDVSMVHGIGLVPPRWCRGR